MPATPIKIQITAEDVAQGGGGASLPDGAPRSTGRFSDIDTPADYEAKLAFVEDYDNRDKGGGHGWIFHYTVETGKGGYVVFRTWLAFSKAARWKMLDVLAAHGIEVNEGDTLQLDPNSLIGQEIGVHVDFPIEKGGEPSKYRDLLAFFPLTAAPSVTEEEEPELAVL